MRRMLRLLDAMAVAVPLELLGVLRVTVGLANLTVSCCWFPTVHLMLYFPEPLLGRSACSALCMPSLCVLTFAHTCPFLLTWDCGHLGTCVPSLPRGGIGTPRPVSKNLKFRAVQNEGAGPPRLFNTVVLFAAVGIATVTRPRDLQVR